MGSLTEVAQKYLNGQKIMSAIRVGFDAASRVWVLQSRQIKKEDGVGRISYFSVNKY